MFDVRIVHRSAISKFFHSIIDPALCIFPAWAVPVDQSPERWPMIKVLKMGKFVGQHIVDALSGCLHEMWVQDHLSIG